MNRMVLAVTLAAALAMPAHAQTADFKTVDADGDGVVTLAEANAAGYPWTEDQFASADADANGGLSPEEFATAAGM